MENYRLYTNGEKQIETRELLTFRIKNTTVCLLTNINKLKSSVKFLTRTETLHLISFYNEKRQRKTISIGYPQFISNLHAIALNRLLIFIQVIALLREMTKFSRVFIKHVHIRE